MKIGCWRKGHSPSLAVSLLLLARFTPSPPLPSRHLFFSFVRLSASLGLGVMTAAPRCVRKLECHVLTGVGGMLTGQTEGTDGSVTCPRSSGVPLLGSLDLKSNTFFSAHFHLVCFLFFSPPPSLLPPTFHSFTSPMSLSLPPLSVSHSVFGSPALSVSNTFSVFLSPPSQSLLHMLLPISA